MGFIVETGRVTFPPTLSVGTEEVNLTKFSAEEPLKAILFFASKENNGGVLNASRWFLIGMTDGTDSACTFTISQDNIANSNTDRRHDVGYVISCINEAGSPIGRAEVIDFTDTSFELSYSQVSLNSYKFTYVAIGGSDLTNAKVVTWAEPETDETNPKSIAVGFQPDCIISTAVGRFEAPPTTGTQAYQMFGVCIGNGTANQRSLVFESITAAANGDVFSRMEEGGAVGRANVTNYSLITMTMESNGFSVNVSATTSTADDSINYSSLCLKGGEYRLLKPQSPTTPQPVDLVTNLTEIAGIISCTHGGNVGRSTEIGRINIGVYDGTNLHSHGVDDEDGVATMSTSCWYFTDRLIQVYDGPSTSILTANASTDRGIITLDWTDVDSAARDLFILVMGPVYDEQATTFWCNF